jgi:hypothetical protein
MSRDRRPFYNDIDAYVWVGASGSIVNLDFKISDFSFT